MTTSLLLAAGVLGTSALAPAPASGASNLTAIYIDGEPGDQISRGMTFVIDESDADVDASTFPNSEVAKVFFSVPPDPAWGDFAWSVDIGAPEGQVLSVGSYTNAVSFSDRDATRPGITVTGNGQRCIQGDVGSFTIHEIAFDGFDVTKLAASFRHRCDGEPVGLWGEVRIDSSIDAKALASWPRAIDFGDHDAGTPTASTDVTVTAIGTLPITMGAASFIGSDPSVFTIDANGCTGVVLQPGQECELTVSALPPTNRRFSAELRVADDTNRGHRGVPLDVRGLADVEATATVSPLKIYPVVDRYVDRLFVQGGRDEPVAVDISISEPAGVAAVVRQASLPQGLGDYRWTWDGKDAGGALVPPGKYDVEVTLTDGGGNTKVVEKRITLSHDHVRWDKARTVMRSGRDFQLIALSRNARADVRGSKFAKGVELESNKGFAAVVYVFELKGTKGKVHDVIRFKVKGGSPNRHKAVIAVWNKKLGGFRDLNNYDAAKLVGPATRKWKTTAAPGGEHVQKGRARAAVMTWKGLGRKGKATFDIARVELTYRTGRLISVAGTASADSGLRQVIERRQGRSTRTIEDVTGRRDAPKAMLHVVADEEDPDAPDASEPDGPSTDAAESDDTADGPSGGAPGQS